MKMVYVLIAAATVAAIGGATSFAGSVPSSSAPTASPSIPMEPRAEPTAAVESELDSVIEGEVLELINVPNYSYLRLGAKGATGTEGTWAAVSTASVKVGDQARVSGATKMPGFTSTTLKRTFAVIYFGSLDAGGGATGLLPPDGHGAAGAPDPHAGGADPHQGMSGKAAIEVKKVDRASGPNGKTVAEVLGQRITLAGKTIRVQATVVKATTGILGSTYLHVRDGSGDASAGTHDLTVTTAATPAVGQVITIEGVVVLDREIGAGYSFPTLIENAKVL